MINFPKEKKTILVLFLLLSLFLSFLTFYIINNNLSSRKSFASPEEKKVSLLFSQEELVSILSDSSEKGKQNFLAIIEKKLESENLTENQRNDLLLRKAFWLTTNRVEVIDSSKTEESRKIFAQVFDNTSNVKNQYDELLHEEALFGPVFAFVNRCFSVGSSLGLSVDINRKYFNFWRSEQYLKGEYSQKDLQEKTFVGFIRILNDDSLFKLFKDDKSFNAFSAITKAYYLDSFRTNFTEKEKKYLIEDIRKNINKYNSGRYISTASTTMRITMTAPFQIAVAKYSIKFAEENISDYSLFEDAYQKVIKTDIPNDSTGRSLAASWIKIHELGAMQRANAKADDIINSVNDLDALLKANPQIIPIVRGYLLYGLTENGRWLLIKQDFFLLAHSSKNLASFLDNLGVKGY